MDQSRLVPVSGGHNRRARSFPDRHSYNASTRPLAESDETGQRQRRRKSRSPARQSSIRSRSSNAITDPFTPVPVLSTASRNVKRGKSSNSVNITTAGAASSGDELMTVDHGQRLRTSVPSTGLSHTLSLDPRLNKKGKHHRGKERETSHRHPRTETSEAEVSALQGPSAASTSAAEAELHRLRKENETLKQLVHDTKKTLKKRDKTIEEYKTQISNMKLAKKDNEAQLQTLKVKNKANEELIATIESSLQCQICMELLSKPYALSPCGHILCVTCLQDWFRKAPPSANDDMDVDEDDPRYIMLRDKSCPCCRAVVTRRPVPVFIVKSITSSLAKARRAGSPSGGSSPPPTDEDPWKGLFPEEGEEEDYYSGEDYDDEDEDDDSGAEIDVPWFNPGIVNMLRHAPFRTYHIHEDEDDDGEGSDDEDEDDVDAEEESGDEAADMSEYDETASYVRPLWEPPAVMVDENFVPRAHLPLLCRGCTSSMVENYGLEYTRDEGIIAYVTSFDAGWLGVGQRGDKGRMSRIFLGWNIDLYTWDEDGDHFMSRIVDDIQSSPGRWQIRPRPRERGVRGEFFDAIRLVREDETEDFDSGETDAYMD